jgi:hypothetical protein
VVAGDLDASAQAQMSVRCEQGRFATHPELLASGFDSSDDVWRDVVIVERLLE